MQHFIRYSLVSVLALAAGRQVCTAETFASRVSQSPLFFEQAPNGTSSATKYFSRGPHYLFGIAGDHAEILLHKATCEKADDMPGRGVTVYDEVSIRKLTLDFPGSNPKPVVSGSSQLPGKVNYFIGNDPAQWRTAPMYSQVRVAEVYPGISMVYYGNGQQFEYDFELQPGADPRQIRIHVSGADGLRVDNQGDLVIDLAGEQIRQAPPQIYQIANGIKQSVNGRYEIEGGNVVRVTVDQYNRSIPLTIDPTLIYSSYFGGNFGDRAYSIKVDGGGNVYFAGQTLSTGFLFGTNSAVTNNPDHSFTNKFQGGKINGDAFVARLGSGGSNQPPAYFTYLGGGGNDGANDIALDPSAPGVVYITGFTGSPDFPIFTTSLNGLSTNINGTLNPSAHIFPTDVFVTELDTTKDGPDSLLFSAYIGGTRADVGIGIALNESSDIFITGFTDSTNFPTTPNGFQTNTTVTNIVLNSHNVPVKTNYYGTTNDVFVTRLNPTQGIIYSSYLAGTNNDVGQGIAALGDMAFVTGFTASTNFPITTNTAFSMGINMSSTNGPKVFHKRKVPLDAFIAEFDTSPTNLIGSNSLPFCSYFGGSNSDAGYRIVIDANKQVYITGNTSSRDFPTNGNRVPIAYGLASSNVINFDAILAQFDFTDPFHPTNVFSFSFGGRSDDVGWDLAVDPDGDIFVVGATVSPRTNFPTSGTNTLVFPLTKTNAGSADVFVTAFTTNATSLLYSFLLGTKLNNYGFAIAVDANKTAYITGETFNPKHHATNFPTQFNPDFSPNLREGAGTNDAFISIITTNSP